MRRQDLRWIRICGASWLWVGLIWAGLAAPVIAQAEGEAPQAEVPRTVEFRGALRDAAGAPITGIQGVTFALYREEQDEAPLWLETQNVRADARGRYTVVLGATLPHGLPLELFSSNEARWLGTQVNLPGETEMPRVLLMSVPYALKAADAETLGGRPLSDFMLAPLSSETCGTGRVRRAVVDRPQTAEETTSKRQAFRVGIGDKSTATSWQLNIAGSLGVARFQGSAQDAITTFQNTAAGGRSWDVIATATGSVAGAGKLSIAESGGLDYLTIDGAGNVGIGTTSPSENLEVASTVKAAAFKFADNTTMTTAGAGLGGNDFTGNQTIDGSLTVTRATGTAISATGGAASGIGLEANGYFGVFGTATPDSPGVGVAGDGGAAGTGVYGVGLVGVHGQGTTNSGSVGVFGESPSATGVGGKFKNGTAGGKILSGLNSADAEVFTLSGSGNVGIGISNPVFPLQIVKSDATATGVQSRVKNTATTGNSFAAFSAEANNGSLVSVFAADGLGTGPMGTAGAYFGTVSNQPIGLTTANVERLRITNTGSVGIGTNAPGATLDVAGLNFMTARFANNASAGDRTAIVDIRNGENVTWRESVGGAGNGLGLTAGQFYLEHLGSGAKLLVNTSGNVGIGTTAPSEKLDVHGNVKVGSSGELFAPGGEENLRIIRGEVNSDGTCGSGIGFTCSRKFGDPSGAYIVTFTTPFASEPAVTATPRCGLDTCGSASVTIFSPSAGVFGAWTVDWSISQKADYGFYFIAIGPR